MSTQHEALDKQKVKQELLAHLSAELVKTESWVSRNERDGFPEAAESWRSEVAKWKGFIALVETFE